MADRPGIRFAFGAATATPDREAFDRCMTRFEAPLAEAARWVRENAAAGASGFGWYDLPERDPADVERAAEWLRGYDAVVHVGIGGSALGNLMLHQALLPLYRNELPVGERGPRFYLADNPDPDKARAIWERVAGSRVALIGVSKSGATAETMSQFLWFKARMEEISGASADGDVLVVTDPRDGVFRAYAEATGCRSLEIPPTVGGRYSVLTPCGLVTASALGGDIGTLLRGARNMKRFLERTEGTRENPARLLAATHRFHERTGRPMAVMMPYASRLETFAEWFAQLWGESLGKDGMGTTPVRALGAVDQHSQVQLYTAGPDDKLYTFVVLGGHAEEVVLPEVTDASLAALSYLSRQGLGEMLGYEARSTAAALIKQGRPVVWIELERLDAEMLGGLIFFYEYTTALTGRLMGVDPFDQPGVEQGKKYTYGMMGREAFAADAREAEAFFGTVLRDVVSVE